MKTLTFRDFGLDVEPEGFAIYVPGKGWKANKKLHRIAPDIAQRLERPVDAIDIILNSIIKGERKKP